MKRETVRSTEERNLDGKADASSTNSFLQITGDPRLSRAVDILNGQSEKLNSKILSALAIRISDSPFTKVLGMIRDLISSLQAEAVAEAEAHGKCEARKAELSIEKESLEKSVSELTNQKDGLEAKTAMLSNEVATLTKKLNNLNRDRSEAVKTRAANKKENERVIAESKAAQEAVSKAMEVLERVRSPS